MPTDPNGVRKKYHLAIISTIRYTSQNQLFYTWQSDFPSLACTLSSDKPSKATNINHMIPPKTSTFKQINFRKFLMSQLWSWTFMKIDSPSWYLVVDGGHSWWFGNGPPSTNANVHVCTRTTMIHFSQEMSNS